MENAVSEELLLAKLSAGSIPAFDILYNKYKQVIYANIFKMVRQPEAAEDILQEVFLALWKNRHKIQQNRSVGGWLFVVSYNKSASYLRQQLKSAIITVPQEAYPENIMAAEPEDDELFRRQLAIVEKAIDQLPPRKQEVFRLCRLEGRAYEEVAEILGISVTSVKDYLKQSTRFIKVYIQSESASLGLTTVAALVLFIDVQ